MSWFDYFTESIKEFLLRCEQDNLEVVYPEPNQVQIDIDSEEAYNLFFRTMGILRDYCQAEYGNAPEIKENPSKSGLPNRHITVTLPFEIKDDLERIALQAVLGSDPVRELMGILRTYLGVKNPSLLVEVKE